MRVVKSVACARTVSSHSTCAPASLVSSESGLSANRRTQWPQFVRHTWYIVMISAVSTTIRAAPEAPYPGFNARIGKKAPSKVREASPATYPQLAEVDS